LKKELKQLFGATTLGQIKTKVAIPTFDLDNEAASPNRTWKPKIFHNFRGKDMDKEALAADVALYTSAAPTYFPSADGFVDGGVYANNPAMVALAQAISMENLAAERAQLGDVALLSVGTGVSQTFIGGKTLDWGTAQWMPQMVNLLMEGVAGIADYQARQLLGQRYQRLQVYLGEERIRLDDVRLLHRMEEIAMGYVGKPHQQSYPDAVDWIEKHWMTR
jgi:patatin-like phospholipase/acyl hydrolase